MGSELCVLVIACVIRLLLESWLGCEWVKRQSALCSRGLCCSKWICKGVLGRLSPTSALQVRVWKLSVSLRTYAFSSFKSDLIDLIFHLKKITVAVVSKS